ncbi:MAG: aldehyde dehydrogenase family protein [Streptosporangiaceae bacterium]
MADHLDTGIVHINDQTLNNDAYAPFGGTGASGNGARFGSQSSWDEFTQWRWVTIRDLAADMFGVGRWWHKRIVRAGPNTLQPYRENPPDRLIGADDIVFCDFGPIFEEWEADFGRTFVLGDDPAKLAIRDALPLIWDAGRDWFETHPGITGEELFAHVVQLSEQAGWEFGGTIAGHLVGQFPHEKIAPTRPGATSCPGPAGRCAAPTARAAPATGSSKSTWSTGTARSAASTRNCSTSLTPPGKRAGAPPGCLAGD